MREVESLYRRVVDEVWNRDTLSLLRQLDQPMPEVE